MRSRLFSSNAFELGEVLVHEVRRLARSAHAAVLEPDDVVAEPEGVHRVVRGDERRAAALHQLGDSAERLRSEELVADCEHFVDEQHLGLERRRDREREPDPHAARVALDRLLVDVPQLGELDHAVDALLDLVLREADEVELLARVLARAQERAQPGGELDQRIERAAPLDAPGRRCGDPGSDAEQRALAGAVPRRSGRSPGRDRARARRRRAQRRARGGADARGRAACGRSDRPS